jgi:predicted peptidase
MFVDVRFPVENGLRMKQVSPFVFATAIFLIATSIITMNRMLIENQTVMKTLSYGGENRSYWIYVPSGYNGSDPIPLVVMLHGAGGNGRGADEMSSWSTIAESEGFIAVFPDGGVWNIYDWNGTGRNDVGFLLAVINKVQEDYVIDASRIYMTGHSMGAGMTITFALEHADILAAIAPASGPWLVSNRSFNIDQHSIPQLNIPIPVYIWRGGNEEWPSANENRLQIQYWVKLDKDNEIPQVITEGLFLTEIYAGGDAEVRYTEIKDGNHDSYRYGTTQKTWYEFFKNLRRTP